MTSRNGAWGIISGTIRCKVDSWIKEVAATYIHLHIYIYTYIHVFKKKYKYFEYPRSIFLSRMTFVQIKGTIEIISLQGIWSTTT